MWNKKGVTLIEMLVVLLIFSVVTMIIFPLFIQTVRLQSEMAEHTEFFQIRRRWQHFSRDVNNARWLFTEPHIEVQMNELAITQDENRLTMEWIPDLNMLEMKIHPRFYHQPYVREYRFFPDSALTWEHQDNMVTFTIEKEEFSQTLQVQFYE